MSGRAWYCGCAGAFIFIILICTIVASMFDDSERNGRYFTDMTEESTEKLLQEIPELQIDECWITSDVRPGRGEEKWLNLILRKSDIH